MSAIHALDSQDQVFSFDPSKVKHWDAAPGYSHKPGDYNTLYLVQGQWYLHIGDVFTELMPGTRPNYATFLTREQARDWFLAVKVPIPEELADLKPAASPRALQQDPSRAEQLPPATIVETPSDLTPVAPREAVESMEWTTAGGPTQWAKLFGVSRTTFLRRLKDGSIRHKKLSTKSYQIAIADLPAKHQAGFRHADKSNPK